MRLVFWIIAIPILALAGAFAAVNRDPVTLKLWPFPFELELPVSAAILGAFIAGIVITGAYGWFSGLGPRLARRRLVRHERKLERENARLEAELFKARNPGQEDAMPDDDARRRALIASGD